jgi:signal transduction histidine kinase
MWIGTQNGGINIFDPIKNAFYSYKHDENDIESIYDNFVETICEDNTGTMWFGTYGGLSIYDNNKKQFVSFHHQANDPSSLSNNIVSDLWQDTSGGIWAGTHGGGLDYLPFDSKQFKHFRHQPYDPASLSSNFILCISGSSDGALWIGTRDQGLNKFDKRTGKAVRFLHDPNDPSSICGDCIIALKEDRKGDLWIGTNYSGLDRMDRISGKFIHYRYRKDDSNSISSDRVMAILEDHHGYLWVGTLGDGVNRFDRRTGACRRYYYKKGDSHSLVSNDVTVLYEDSHGVLWVGTLGGISRYNEASNSFTSFTKQDGLVDNNIGTIVSDTKKNLWITTNNGLSKFDPCTGTFRNFEKADGLPTTDFNQESGCLRKDGCMFFGGDPGIVAFHPDSIHENSFIPPVVITRFKVFEQPMPIPMNAQGIADVVLSYDQNYFSFEFAALSFTAPEKNMYKYMLDGIDKGWISCGMRRYAAYTHLSPGYYVFHVQGSNNDGVWNTKGASISVRILPPYWETWWFRAIYIFFSLLCIASVVYWRINYLRRRTAEHQKVAQQLIESQENERKRIGTSLHDSLGQNLLVIKNLAVLGAEANKQHESSDEQLGEISSIASQTLAEVREISYNLRPYHLDQLGLTGALHSIVSRIETSSQIAFTGTFDNVDNLLPKDQDINVFRIVQESINNIIKHSGATNAAVQVKREKDAIIIIVSDNGRGFDNSHQGFGLTGIAERVRILGGSLVIKSKSGTGTTVSAAIPLKSTSL